MATIKFDLETIKRCVSDYNREAQDMESIINKMDNTLNNLRDGWEGKAMQAFDQRYEAEFKPSLNNARKLIQDISECVNTIMANAVDFDESQKI